MAIWQLQEAKARLSELVEQAQVNGPQFITRHGTKRAVLLSPNEYQRLLKKNKTFAEHLLAIPRVSLPEIKRKTDPERDLNL